MPPPAIWICVGLPVALLMEPWAAVLHGAIWHGVLYPVHRSHHRRRVGRFEANDALSVLHAPIAIALILYGCVATPSIGREIAFGVGLGMTAFGLAYLLVHDGLVHGRVPASFLARSAYLRRVRDAHLVHHQRARGPYGLFFGPWEMRFTAHPRTKARPSASDQRASDEGSSVESTSA